MTVVLAPAARAQRGPATDQFSESSERKITARQIENMEARVALATSLVARLAPEAKALGRASGWTQASLDALLALPLAQLQRVEQEAYSADRLQDAIRSAKAEGQLIGSPTEDLVYTPIPPCRYIDTRIVGGRFSGFRDYDLAENGGIYGGNASCDPTANFGVADDQIGALAMNLTILDPLQAAGFAAAKPTQAAPLTSLVNWYEVGPAVQAANLAVVTMDQTAAVPEFVLQTSAPVHTIVDIFGAFLAPEATALDVTTVSTQWSLLLQLQFDVSATCPAGYAVTGGGFNSVTGTGTVVPFQLSKDGANNAYRCRGISVSLLPITASGTCEAICARTPGR